MKEATEVTRTRKNGNENRSESRSPDILKKKSVNILSKLGWSPERAEGEYNYL